MPKTKTTPYDVAEHLRTTEEMAAYLEASLEEANGDAMFIAKHAPDSDRGALGDIARVRGINEVARDTGLSQEWLRNTLSGKESPDFDTVLKVTRALGLRLHAEPAYSPDAPAAGYVAESGD